MELRNFVHELHTTVIKIKYANKATKEREDFYNFLNSICIFYGIHFDGLLIEFEKNKDIRYVMTELRKAANDFREEICLKTNKYIDYLNEKEKEEINLLYK